MLSACLCGNWLFDLSNSHVPEKLAPFCALTATTPIINAQNKPQKVNALFIILSPCEILSEFELTAPPLSAKPEKGDIIPISKDAGARRTVTKSFNLRPHPRPFAQFLRGDSWRRRT